MTREQAEIEVMKIYDELNIQHERIMEKAKQKGIWKQGLDGNRDLFIDADNEAKEKIRLLASMIDED